VWYGYLQNAYLQPLLALSITLLLFLRHQNGIHLRSFGGKSRRLMQAMARMEVAFIIGRGCNSRTQLLCARPGAGGAACAQCGAI